MPTLEDRVELLEQQQAILTDLARRLLEGRLEGAEGAAALVVALEGGRTSIEVGLGKALRR
jgi:hypothetical protein